MSAAAQQRTDQTKSKKRTAAAKPTDAALAAARRAGKLEGYTEAINALQPMVDRMQTLRVALDEQLGGLIDDLGRWRKKHQVVATTPTEADDLFITIPETTLPGGRVVPAFRVSSVLCSKDDNGQLALSFTRKPWVDVTYHAARAACQAAGGQLITESQALAIAHLVAQHPANWSSGDVGVGSLKQGIRKGSVNSAHPANYEPPADENRIFILPSGDTLYDIAGNAYTWVFDDIQGDEKGLIAKPFASDSPSITTAPAPSLEKGVGWYPRAGADWSGDALVRGGFWYSDSSGGVFYLGYGWPGDAGDVVGFRCTKSL